jgi:hypothetical protein
MSESGGRLVFRASPFVRFWSWAWLGAALVLILDVIRRESVESSGWIAIAALLFVSSIVWVSGLRPMVAADDERVVLRNPLREVVVPWPAVTSIEATDMLRVQVGDKSHGSWAIQVPNRTRRRAAQAPDLVKGEGARVPSTEVRSDVSGRTHADFVAEQLRDRWAAHRPAATGSPQSASSAADQAAWSPTALAAVLGTLVLLVVTIVAA